MRNLTNGIICKKFKTAEPSSFSSKNITGLLFFVVLIFLFSFPVAVTAQPLSIPVTPKGNLETKAVKDTKNIARPIEKALFTKVSSPSKDTVLYTLPSSKITGIKKTTATKDNVKTVGNEALKKDKERTISQAQSANASKAPEINQKATGTNNTSSTSSVYLNRENSKNIIPAVNKTTGTSSPLGTSFPLNATSNKETKGSGVVTSATPGSAASQTTANTFRASGTRTHQVDTNIVSVAVFAPLFIDNAFSGSTYTLGKSNLPKNILPGLEFYNGVMMAVDSLSAEGLKVELIVFDTKQSNQSLAQILTAPELRNVGLMIAAITSTLELKQFSQFAASKNIPLISATYPNTVGVSANPNFVLLNSSFSTHLQGLHNYIRQFYPTNNIIAFRQAGATEDFIKNYFIELNKNSRPAPLNIKWVDLKEGFTPVDVLRHLDTIKNNVIYVASPAESFGLKVVKTISGNESYRCTAIGMPTWDGIKELNGRDCRNVEIVYSTPFVYSRNYNLSNDLIKRYREKYYSRPSDMVYKGFETTFHFTKLLSKHKSNLISNLSDKDFTLFNQFDIQPVKARRTSEQPDFMENKKLYFIKKQNGNIRSII